MKPPDLLEAAKAIGPYVRGDYAFDATYVRAFDAFASAISSEEARREDRRLPCGCVRCACEDPEQCQGCGGREAAACQASRLSGGPKHASAQPAAVDPRDATIRDQRALLERCAKAARYAAAIARGAKVLATAGGHGESERVYASAEVEFESLAASLRAAGVEPAPAREGKARR